jgi:hypothetical protein
VARLAAGSVDVRGTFNVATPELAGTIAPTVVGSQERSKIPRLV